jgi:hypothetical protein
VAVEDGSEMSGMGLYHFYQGTGGYCQDLLVIPKGGSGHALFLIRTGELDTGMVSVNLTPVPAIRIMGRWGRMSCPHGRQEFMQPLTLTGSRAGALRIILPICPLRLIPRSGPGIIASVHS